jgi:hypothetical protein
MRVTLSSERAHRSATCWYVLRPWLAIRPTKCVLFLVLFLPVSLSLSIGFAMEWYVDAATAPGGHGSLWEKAFNGIQDAADAATDGDTMSRVPPCERRVDK